MGTLDKIISTVRVKSKYFFIKKNSEDILSSHIHCITINYICYYGNVDFEYSREPIDLLNYFWLDMEEDIKPLKRAKKFISKHVAFWLDDGYELIDEFELMEMISGRPMSDMQKDSAQKTLYFDGLLRVVEIKKYANQIEINSQMPEKNEILLSENKKHILTFSDSEKLEETWKERIAHFKDFLSLKMVDKSVIEKKYKFVEPKEQYNKLVFVEDKKAEQMAKEKEEAKKIYLEKPSSKRFAELQLKENRCITRSGRIGAKVKPKIKEFSDKIKAENNFHTKVLEKFKTGYYPPENNSKAHRENFPLMLDVLRQKRCNTLNWFHRTGDMELFFFDWQGSQSYFPKHRTYLLELNRKRHFWRIWYLHDFDRPQAIDSPTESVVVIVDRDLRVARYSQDKGVIIENPMEEENFRIDLEQVKVIGTDLFAIAWRRRIYKRIGENRWENIADAIKPSEKLTSGEIGFSSISGISETDFYAAGGKNDLWRFNGTEFQKISLKNKHPGKIRCIDSKDQELYIGGNGAYIHTYEIQSNEAIFKEVMLKPKMKGTILGFHNIKGKQVISYEDADFLDTVKFLEYDISSKKFIDFNMENKMTFNKIYETESQIFCWNDYELKYAVVDKKSGIVEEIEVNTV